ncbi:MAG TPA: tetratricopeptide repeat protein, partial [bacterium]
QAWVNTNFWLVDTFQETGLFGIPLSAQGGGIALAGKYFSYGTLQGRDETGSLAPDYNPYRLNLKAGGGVEILKDFSFGVGFEGSQTQIAESTSWTFTADFGILFKPFEKFRFGAAYENLGLSPTPGSVAAALHLGISYEVPLNSIDSLLTAASGSIDPGGVNYLEAGVEYSFHRRFFLRAGYQQPLSDNGIGGLTRLTAGAGFAFSAFCLDYAYLPYGDLGMSHRISLGYHWGGANPANSSGNVKKAESLVSPAASGTGAETASPTTRLSGSPKKAGSPLLGQVGSVVPKASTEPSAGDKDSLIVQFDMPSDALTDGKALEKQGQYQQALRLYKASIRQNPRDVSAWWAMGDLYRRLGQKEYAVQCFEQVVQFEPNNKKIADWLEQFKASKP